MTPVIQYTRLTHADKLSDRFITSQVYRPADPESQREGVIFSQIEILNPWLPATQIGQTIINTAIREYYRASDTSELNNFEVALKKVNETLAQITQNGETEWIGKLNGVLILINNQDIHISQTGQTQAYLFRKTKINHITEGLAGAADPHPLKTFSNITSGTLEPLDKIIIANSAFYEAITLDQIKEIVANSVPALAAEEFARLLKREKQVHAEALILAMTTKEDVASMPPEYKIDTIYLDRRAGVNLSSLKDGLRRVGKPALGVVLTGTGKILKKADHHFETRILPAVRSTSAKTYHFSRRLAGKAVRRIRKNKIRRYGDNEAGSSAGLQAPAAVAKVTEPATRYLGTAGRWIAEKFSFQRAGAGNKARRYGIWGAALLIVLVLLIIAARYTGEKKYNPTDNLQQLVGTLGDKFNRVKLLSAYNDRPAALEELSAIISQIQDAADRQELPPSLLELKKQAVHELAALTNSTEAQSAETLAPWGGRNFVAALENQTFVVDSQKLTIVPGDTDIDLTPLTTVTAVAAKPDSKIIYLLAVSGMWQFDAEDKSLAQLKTAGGKWPESVSFRSFADNLYLLDATGNQILKYTPRDDGYGAGAPYSQPEAQELNNAIDIAVNGAVLALLKDGRVVKYTQAGRTPVELTDLPAANFLNAPRRIFAHSDSSEIAVLHQDAWIKDLFRLSFFTRAGKYKKGIILPPDQGIVGDAVCDLKTGLATVVTDKSVYRVNTGSG